MEQSRNIEMWHCPHLIRFSPRFLMTSNKFLFAGFCLAETRGDAWRSFLSVAFMWCLQGNLPDFLPHYSPSPLFAQSILNFSRTLEDAPLFLWLLNACFVYSSRHPLYVSCMTFLHDNCFNWLFFSFFLHIGNLNMDCAWLLMNGVFILCALFHQKASNAALQLWKKLLLSLL